MMKLRRKAITVKKSRETDAPAPANVKNQLPTRQKAPGVSNPARKNPAHSPTNRKVSNTK